MAFRVCLDCDHAVDDDGPCGGHGKHCPSKDNSNITYQCGWCDYRSKRKSAFDEKTGGCYECQYMFENDIDEQ